MDAKEEISFVELITVIAFIIVITTMVAPVYANHRVRNRIFSELEKLKTISQYISNESGVINYSFENLTNIPKDFYIKPGGAIALNTDNIVTGSSISLVPTLTSGAIVWSCVSIGLSKLQIPKSCKQNSTYRKKFVKSLYDLTKDSDSFIVIQHGQEEVMVKCTVHKCTITEINGKRWLAQYIEQLNTIQLYKEDSDYLIYIQESNLSIDPSLVDSELLQQFIRLCAQK
ncbi:pilin [Francisella sp. 19X1-34]|uniref:pilin n=1 Tax=Francisella sp. 19X1-34 TaxID=3087177 RepID=UPI002E337E19|nr:pilin [Francisella sp. 19X1-34]MED7789043.1 pilin [Francisella sp. 19X1-34]